MVSVKGWEYGVSEELPTDRFPRRRQLLAICHPIEGEPMATTSRCKQSADGGQDCFTDGRLFGRTVSVGESPAYG